MPLKYTNNKNITHPEKKFWMVNLYNKRLYMCELWSNQALIPHIHTLNISRNVGIVVQSATIGVSRLCKVIFIPGEIARAMV